MLIQFNQWAHLGFQKFLYVSVDVKCNQKSRLSLFWGGGGKLHMDHNTNSAFLNILLFYELYNDYDFLQIEA